MELNQCKILVIGDVMLDHYIYGSCSRISPEAPVQVVEVKRDEYTLGGAGNVLQNLIAYKCQAGLISVVGDDDDAQLVFEKLNKDGVDTGTVLRDSERCTTVKSRVLVSNHQLIRLDREVTEVIREDTVSRLNEIVARELANYNIVLISDYNKGLLSSTFLSNIFQLCRQAGIYSIVDPKGNDYSKYKGANLIKPNKKEAILASGINIKDENSLTEACIKIKEITNCDDVIVTMSEEGMAMYTKNALQIIPTKALEVIDVTGAGDTVLASLGLAIASGENLYEACNFANHAAAVVVSKVGSATATLDEVFKKLKEVA